MIIQGPFNELIPNSNNPLTQLFFLWDPSLNLETGPYLCMFIPVCYIPYIWWNWGFVTDCWRIWVKCNQNIYNSLHLSSFPLSRTVFVIVSLYLSFPLINGQLLTAYAWENLEINNDRKKTLLFILQTFPHAARWEH